MEESMKGRTNQEWLDGVYDKLLAKMSAECARLGTMIPVAPRNGKYFDVENTPLGLHFWTNGFWPGMLWQMYHATGDESYRKAAEGVEERLEAILKSFDGVDHDAGFQFLLSAVADYRVTGSKEARRRGLHAANMLAGRYNPAGRFIRAWNDGTAEAETTAEWMKAGGGVSGWMIVDCMMNIPLLYWAASETKDPRYMHIAVNHSKTAQQYIVRPDGSCNHVVSMDPNTGEFVDNPGGQGYGRGSSWSRGQSWAVYGFALSYRHTGDESFLNTAKQCAHYCIANLAVNDWLPLVDFRAPEEPVKYDSDAAIIIACGLLEIAEHVGEYEKQFYTEAAYRILRACDEKFCNWDPEVDSIVDGGTTFYHDPSGRTSDMPIIYGDYYFIEAVLRLKGKSLFAW